MTVVWKIDEKGNVWECETRELTLFGYPYTEQWFFIIIRGWKE